MEQLIFFTLLFSLALGHFVFIFTKTDFVVEYAKLLRLNKLFKTEEYETWKNEEHAGMPGYHIFLREKYTNFFGHLVGCPFCLITFASVLCATFTLKWWCVLLGFGAASIATIVYLTENLLCRKNFE